MQGLAKLGVLGLKVPAPLLQKREGLSNPVEDVQHAVHQFGTLSSLNPVPPESVAPRVTFWNATAVPLW